MCQREAGRACSTTYSRWGADTATFGGLAPQGLSRPCTGCPAQATSRETLDTQAGFARRARRAPFPDVHPERLAQIARMVANEAARGLLDGYRKKPPVSEKAWRDLVTEYDL